MSSLPLVLLHAFPLDATMWTPVVAALGPGVPVVLTPDLPGLGSAPLPDGPPDLAVAADLVAAALDEAGHQQAVLAGVSMGGYVAMAFARRHRQRLAGLALIDTKAGADDEAARSNRYRVAEAVLAAGDTGALAPMLDALLGATTRDERPDLVDDVRARIAAARPEGVAWSQRAMAGRPDSLDLLRTLDVPAAVVVGQEDTLSPPDLAREMADALPDAVLTVLPGAGHLAAMEAPDDVAAALTALMVRVRPAP